MKNIKMTDQYGNLSMSSEDAWEPEPGSVVLTEGAFGTAWQRWFSDGLWRRVGGGPNQKKGWAWLTTRPNLILVYDAPVRKPQRATTEGGKSDG